MDEGFILSNKFRRAVFDELASGETDVERIAKKHHLVRRVVERVIDEFITGDLLEKKGHRYALTEKGQKLVATLGKG